MKKSMKTVEPGKEVMAVVEKQEGSVEFQNSSGSEEEEDEDDDPFDDTLEKLMSINNSKDQSADNEDGEGGGAQKKDDENSAKHENQHSLKKSVRILRFLQLLVEGHYTPL